MIKSDNIIFKPTLFYKILILLFGVLCFWFAFGTDFLPQAAQDISNGKGLLSIENALLLLHLLFGVMGLAAFIVFVAPYQVKITPQDIQGPICTSPVPWHEIKRVEYHKIKHTKILTFHMKEDCYANTRILYLFPAKQKSFAIILSQYRADNQDEILSAIENHCILEKKR